MKCPKEPSRQPNISATTAEAHQGYGSQNLVEGEFHSILTHINPRGANISLYLRCHARRSYGQVHRPERRTEFLSDAFAVASSSSSGHLH